MLTANKLEYSTFYLTVTVQDHKRPGIAPGTIAGVVNRGSGGGTTSTGQASATAGCMSGRAVPRAEGVTFESGSGGRRMEKGRGAAAAGQPLYIRAGRLSDPPLGGHLPGTSRTRKPVCCHGVFVCALHGVSPRDRWTCV